MVATLERRRSARHLLGTIAELHVGATTVRGVVEDISLHGMAVVVPKSLQISIGDLVWIIVSEVASYAMTGTVQRVGPDGRIGIEFDEILAGEALDRIDELPLTEDIEPTS